MNGYSPSPDLINKIKSLKSGKLIPDDVMDRAKKANLMEEGMQAEIKRMPRDEYRMGAVNDNPRLPFDEQEVYSRSPQNDNEMGQSQSSKQEQIKRAREDYENEVDPEKKARKRKILWTILSAALGDAGSAFQTMAGNPEAYKQVAETFENIRSSVEEGNRNRMGTKETEAARGLALHNNPWLQNKPWFEQMSASDIYEMGLDKPNMSMQEKMALAGRGPQEERMDQEAERRLKTYEDKQIQTLGKNVAPFQKALGATSEVERFLGAPIEDIRKDADLPGVHIPGLGRVSFYDKDARQLDSSLSKIFNIELKDRSGAAVTSQELERLKEEYEKGLWRSEDELINGLKRYKREMLRLMQDREAEVRPELREEYKERGGRLSDDFSSNRQNTGYIIGRAKDGKRYYFDPVTKRNMGEVR